MPVPLPQRPETGNPTGGCRVDARGDGPLDARGGAPTDAGEATPPDLLPSDADVAFYHAHGFYLSKEILPPALLDAAERGMERFYAGDHDAPFIERDQAVAPGWRPPAGFRPPIGPALRKNDYASFQVRELGALVRYPAIGAVARRLTGSPSIRLWHDQLLYKPPIAEAAAAKVGWHTDRQYWQVCSSDEMLTAWVAFHDVDETIGTITFIDGSHLWPLNELNFFDPDLEALEQRFQTGGHPVIKVPAIMKRGQVSFHHCRLIHGSGPNLSTAPRRAIAIHLQPADNRYRPWQKADGTPARHANDRLCRLVDGEPDYTDPRVCPRLA